MTGRQIPIRRSARTKIAGGLLASALLVSFPARGATTYQYDALGRVVSASYDDGSTVTYAYDARGNRTTVTNSGGSGAGGPYRAIVVPLNGFTVIPLP